MASGQVEKAEEYLMKLEHENVKYEVEPVLIAGVFASLGKTDKVWHWLERGWAERSIWMVALNASPEWEPLREHPRFQDFMEKMDFPGEE